MKTEKGFIAHFKETVESAPKKPHRSIVTIPDWRIRINEPNKVRYYSDPRGAYGNLIEANLHDDSAEYHLVSRLGHVTITTTDLSSVSKVCDDSRGFKMIDGCGIHPHDTLDSALKKLLIIGTNPVYEHFLIADDCTQHPWTQNVHEFTTRRANLQEIQESDRRLFTVSKSRISMQLVYHNALPTNLLLDLGIPLKPMEDYQKRDQQMVGREIFLRIGTGHFDTGLAAIPPGLYD